MTCFKAALWSFQLLFKITTVTSLFKVSLTSSFEDIDSFILEVVVIKYFTFFLYLFNQKSHTLSIDKLINILSHRFKSWSVESSIAIRGKITLYTFLLIQQCNYKFITQLYNYFYHCLKMNNLFAVRVFFTTKLWRNVCSKQKS